MSIHSVCANTSILRLLIKTQRFKWTSALNKNLLCSNKVYQCSFEPTSRIIRTDASIQPYNCDIQESEKDQQAFYLQESFLKVNFNIVDAGYFKLVTLPSECNNLEQLLWTNEFKKVLARSPFSYDVNVVEGTRSMVWEISAAEDSPVKKQSINGFEMLFSNSSNKKESIQGKPSEEQLLHVIDRLTYSLVNFFEKPHDFSIYNKNIIFQNNIKGVIIKGLNAYAQSIYIMRLCGFLHFSKVKVEILKMTHHIEDRTVRVRWRINGLPRHKLVIMLLKHKTLSWQHLPKEETEWLDGFSIFSVGDDGLIFKHICDKMMPDHEQLFSKNVDLKSKVLGLLGLTPRSPAAGTINTLIPCCRSQDLFCGKKLT